MVLLRAAVLSLIVGISLFVAMCSGQEPDWLGQVVARGELRAKIQSSSIVNRPYRPLHFYGNTVRRAYYRGSILPTPSDLAQGTAALLRQ
jgi:hypothetical protein